MLSTSTFEYPELKNEIIINEDTFADELIAQFEFDNKRDPNKLLGLPLTKFQTLATNIDGLQSGFYFLGAESNVGKTALLTNLALDVLDTNSDATVLYFSLDDSRLYTTYRCLSILTGFHINSVRKPRCKPYRFSYTSGTEKCISELCEKRKTDLEGFIRGLSYGSPDEIHRGLSG